MMVRDDLSNNSALGLNSNGSVPNWFSNLDNLCPNGGLVGNNQSDLMSVDHLNGQGGCVLDFFKNLPEHLEFSAGHMENSADKRYGARSGGKSPSQQLNTKKNSDDGGIMARKHARVEGFDGLEAEDVKKTDLMEVVTPNVDVNMQGKTVGGENGGRKVKLSYVQAIRGDESVIHVFIHSRELQTLSGSRARSAR